MERKTQKLYTKHYKILWIESKYFDLVESQFKGSNIQQNKYGKWHKTILYVWCTLYSDVD